MTPSSRASKADAVRSVSRAQKASHRSASPFYLTLDRTISGAEYSPQVKMRAEATKIVKMDLHISPHQGGKRPQGVQSSRLSNDCRLSKQRFVRERARAENARGFSNSRTSTIGLLSGQRYVVSRRTGSKTDRKARFYDDCKRRARSRCYEKPVFVAATATRMACTLQRRNRVIVQEVVPPHIDRRRLCQTL